MNSITMKTWFELIQDKSGSAYFSDADISLFINRAQIDFVGSLLEGDGKRTQNAETSQDTLSQLSPLIIELPSLSMNSTGVITKAAVQAALTAIDADAELWRPLAIGLQLGKTKVPAKYLRHNDRWEFETNYFKKPSTRNPKVRETYNSYIIAPVMMSAGVYFTVLKYPLEVDITNTISSDLPESTHNMILAMALEYAGIGSRDTNMAQLLKLQQGAVNG